MCRFALLTVVFLSHQVEFVVLIHHVDEKVVRNLHIDRMDVNASKKDREKERERRNEVNITFD